MAKKISSELLGITFDPMPVEWDSSKAQLYAVAVGAKPPEELTVKNRVLLLAFKKDNKKKRQPTEA